MASYVIDVTRDESDGTLKCSAAKVNSKCWWDLKNAKGVIPAGTYPGCSATVMATKGHNAIFLPNVKGWKGIFIHVGSGPNASSGCIVIKKAEMEKLHAAIEPKDGKNVTVKITDTVPRGGAEEDPQAAKEALAANAAHVAKVEAYLAHLQKNRKAITEMYDSNAKQAGEIYREMKRMSDGVDAAATVLTMAVGLTKLGIKGAQAAKASAEEAAKIAKELARDTAKDIGKKHAQAAAYIARDSAKGDSAAWLFTSALADGWFKLNSPSFWAHTYVQIAKEGKSWSEAVTYDPDEEHRNAMATLAQGRDEALKALDARIKAYEAILATLRKESR